MNIKELILNEKTKDFDALKSKSETLSVVGGYRLYKVKKFNWYKSKVDTLYHVENVEMWPELKNLDAIPCPKSRYNFKTRKEAEKYLVSILTADKLKGFDFTKHLKG